MPCGISQLKTNISQHLAARCHELHLRLRQGEKRKFCWQTQTDKERQVTLSGDEIIGNIIQNTMALIPIAVSPHSRIGSLFECFLYGEESYPMDFYSNDRPNDKQAEQLARSAS